MEKKDLEVMRIWYGISQQEGSQMEPFRMKEELWMDETDTEVGNLFCHKIYLGLQLR